MAKKPGIGNADGSPGWAQRLSSCLEVMLGRSKDGKTPKASVQSLAVAAAPTATEFNALRDDVVRLTAQFNKLLDQVQDP